MAAIEDLQKLVQREPHEFLYLLVNPLVTIDTEEKLHVEQLRSGLTVTVVPRADFAHAPEQCPQLVTLALPEQEPDNALLDAALDWALNELGYDRRYVCGWLISDEGPLEVAQTLAKHCIVSESHEALQRSLIPLFEPLRLELLQKTATADWLSGWMGCVSRLVYLNAHGSLSSLNRTTVVQWNPVMPEAVSRAQFHAKPANTLLLAWRRAQENLPPDAAWQALEQIRTAYLIGLFALEDQLVFGLNRLTIHPKLERHPAVLTAIQQAGLGKSSLAQAWNALDDEVWDEVEEMPR